MQLHEQTQRFILLLIFYLLGPILTLGIIGGIVLRKLPANARHWERILTQQTGLHWEIEAVEHRSPGFVRLHKVQVLDDTAQRPVFYVEKIDIQRMTNTNRNKIFPGIAIPSDESPAWNGLTNLLAGSLPSFRSDDQFLQITAPAAFLIFKDYSSENSALLVQNMLRKVFARLETLADVPVQFVFEEIYVVSEHSLKRAENKADLFRLVQGNLYRTPAEIRSDWSFEIKDISDIDRLHLSFTLSLTDTLKIAFRTGRQPIPCDLAAVFCPPFKHFSGGTFLGEFAVSARIGHNTRTFRLRNAAFNNVPLAPLVSTYTDFAVVGTIADLRFQQAVFGAEGIYAEGHLRVLNGAVEKALFHRCVDNFQLTVEPASILDAPMQMIPFTESAIHFRFQPESIDFWADHFWNDVLLYYQESNLSPPLFRVRFPAHRQPVTYHSLMSIFASDSAPSVPLTPGLQSLLPYVPMQ